jgi:hypothetical protein
MWLSEMIKYFMLFSFLGFCIAKIAYSTNTWTLIPGVTSVSATFEQSFGV